MTNFIGQQLSFYENKNRFFSSYGFDLASSAKFKVFI